MFALGCFAPLFFIVVLFLGIASSVSMTTQSASAAAATQVVVTAVAPPPTPKSYEPDLHLDVVARIVAGETTIVELVK